jgi:nucleoside-diphosphate-sugar epimerase
MITVLGSSGFVGSNLVKQLVENNIEFETPIRNDNLNNKFRGDIIYCIGLTSDFRQKPFETIEAHICLLTKILKEVDFNSLTYLSSTRLYVNSNEKEANESSEIKISINDSDELYTLTKLTGERICLSSGRNTKIARLSNVFGVDYNSTNFLFDLLNKAKNTSKIELFSTLNSAKDYISIESVTSMLLDISMSKCSGIYNIANGENLSNEELLLIIKQFFDFEYSIHSDAKEIVHPIINIDKIKQEFNFVKEDTKQKLFNLIKNYKNDTSRRGRKTSN